LKELHRPPPPQRGQTSAQLRYLTANTTAAQRLRALGRGRQSGGGCRPTQDVQTVKTKLLLPTSAFPAALAMHDIGKRP
jgi:hypothetical protein